MRSLALSFLVLSLAVAFVRADSLDEDSLAEGRFFNGNNNNNNGNNQNNNLFSFNNNGLNNNTIDLRALLAAGLIGLLFAIVLGASFLDQGTGYGYGYQQKNSQGHGYQGQNFYQRSDKHIYENDLASQMYQLEEILKKYEVEDPTCKIYVACEASQEARHEENGALAKDVFALMRSMKKRGRKALLAKDPKLAQLMDAFVYGEGAQAELKDACQKLRSDCYEATKKPVY